MRRRTAVNYDRRCALEQARTSNAGMCPCTATVETRHFPGNCDPGRNLNQVKFGLQKSRDSKLPI